MGFPDDHAAETADFGGGEEANPAVAAVAAAIAGREVGLMAAEELPEAGDLHREEVGGNYQATWPVYYDPEYF